MKCLIVVLALAAAAVAVPYVGKISISEVGPLTMFSGMNRTIQFTLSQPIICVNSTTRKCGVVVLITNTNPRDIFIDNCAVKWGKEDWWQPRLINIMIKPTFINRAQLNNALITEAPLTDAPFYNTTDANPADIVLITQTRPSRSCSGVGDPHYTTFDGQYWHSYQAGQYVFYGSRDPSRIFEAQTKTRGYPGQHCAMAVRENNGVARVDYCSGGAVIDVRGTGVTLTTSGNTYTFRTAGGSVLTLSGSVATATAPGTDYGLTYGMCGNDNGIASDDSPVPYGGVVTVNTNLFQDQQMIPGRINLFTWVPSADAPVIPPPTRLECNYTNEPYVPPVIIAPVVDITDLLRAHESDNVTTPAFVMPTTPAGQTTVPMTEVSARATCTANITGSPVVAACAAQLNIVLTPYIDGCVADFLLDGASSQWIFAAVDSIQQECAIVAQQLDRLSDPTLNDALCATSNTLVCSGLGTCVNRTCVCSAGRAGADCTIDTSRPPTLTKIEDSVCDAVGLRFCPSATILVFGNNFFNGPNLGCLFGSARAPAMYVSSTVVLCALPHPAFQGFPENRVNVKVTNDGTSYSNSATMIYYDSRCQICSAADLTCSPNPQSCVVGGQCYVNSQGSPDNVCMVCNTAKSSLAFSYDYSHSVCQPKFIQDTYTIRIVANGVSGTTVLTVDAKNPLVANDTQNVVRYSLREPSAYFAVNQLTGVVSVIQNFAVSYNLRATIPSTLTVIARDSQNNTAEASVLLELLDAEVPPLFDQTSYNGTIPENSPIGTVVGRVQSLSSGVVYSFYVQPQSFAGSLAINASTGVITVAAMIDYELAPVAADNTRQLPFVVKAADSSTGQNALVGFTLFITNVNEAPTSIGLTGSSIPENSPADTVVGVLNTVDPDSGSTFTYTLITPSTPFKIVGNQLLTNGNPIDFETQPQYTIQIRSADNGNLLVARNFNITVVNVNEPPYNIRAVGNLSIPETTAVGTPLEITFTAVDPEGDAYECGLVQADDGKFLVFNNRLVLAGALDFRTRALYTIDIVCADRNVNSQLSAPAYFNITVLDMPQPPQLAPIPILLPPEFTGLDPNAGSQTEAPVTTTTTAGAGAGAGASTTTAEGGIIIATTTTAGAATGPTTTTTAPRVSGIPENVPPFTIIGAVQAVDPDSNAGNFTFQIAGDQVGLFQIANTTCQPRATDGSVTCTATIMTLSPDSFDFENPLAHEIHVLVTDKFGQTTRLIVPVNVINENDPPSTPVWVTDPTGEFTPGQVMENSAVNTYVGTLIGQDEDASQTLNMDILQPQGDFFRLVPVTTATPSRRRSVTMPSSRQVEVRLGNDAVLDYELQPVVTLRINVSDNGVPARWSVVEVNITVTNEPMVPLLDNRPTDVNNAVWNLPENSVHVGYITVQGFDRADLDEVVTLNDNQDGVFAVRKIQRNQWELTSQSLDYETATKRTFMVGITLSFQKNGVADTTVPTVLRVVRIELINVDEAPAFNAALYQAEVNTDSLLFRTILQTRAVDPDGDVVTYTLVGSSVFGVNSTGGQVFASQSMDGLIVSPNHDYNLTLTVIATSQAAGKAALTNTSTITFHMVDDCYNVQCPVGTGPCFDKTSVGVRNNYTCDTSFTAGGLGGDNNGAASTGSDGSVGGGAIAGIAVGIAVLVAALAFLALVAYRRRQKPLMLESQYSTVSALDNPNYGISGPVGPAKANVDHGLSNPLYKWYMPDMSRQDAEEFLLDAEDGSFVVRDSTATPGWHMIAVKTKDSIVHEKIKMSDDGLYELLPSSNRKQPKFSALPDLIEHYAKPQDGVKFALYVDNPLYDNSQLMERKTGRAVAATWTHENDPSAPSVPLKEKERMLVSQVANGEDEDIYTNTNEAKNALSVV